MKWNVLLILIIGYYILYIYVIISATNMVINYQFKDVVKIHSSLFSCELAGQLLFKIMN